MYDYATNKNVPARFYNYVTKTWSDEAPQANVVVHEGRVECCAGDDVCAVCAQGLALQKTQIGEGVRNGSFGGVRCELSPVWVSGEDCGDGNRAFLMVWMFRWKGLLRSRLGCGVAEACFEGN